MENFGWAVCFPVGRGWCNPGSPFVSTVGNTRREAIQRFLSIGFDRLQPMDGRKWKVAYRQGWRARHVRIEAILFGGN